MSPALITTHSDGGMPHNEKRSLSGGNTRVISVHPERTTLVAREIPAESSASGIEFFISGNPREIPIYSRLGLKLHPLRVDCREYIATYTRGEARFPHS